MPSYVWVAYFSKAFGIFQLIFPTRFVGDNLWEIPPKKAYENLFQDSFKEFFVDVFPRNIIQRFFCDFLELTISDLLVRSFQDFFSDICSRCWWNINKNMSIQNIKIFPRNLPHLFLNNAYFAADIHISGLRIFTKAFGFFLGYFQQDLLGIIYGRSLLRKPTEIYSRIFLRNCLWIYFQEILFNIFWLSLLKIFPKKLRGQEICLANLSWTPGVISATKKIQQSREDIPPKGKNILGDIPQDTALILKILCERYGRKKGSRSIGGNSSPIYPWRNFFGKQVPKNVINQLPNWVRNIF